MLLNGVMLEADDLDTDIEADMPVGEAADLFFSLV
jgi:hypothetical protein